VSLALSARIDPKVLGPTFTYRIDRPPYFVRGAPTLEVKPGETIRVAYHNILPPILSDDAHGLPDATNLHFHGLTLSPNAPADDVLTTLLMPLGRTTYDIRVAVDQPPGIYWYHPHPHHETSWQVGNGMAGAILVDGIENVEPSLGGLRQRVIVLRQVYLHPDTDEAAVATRFCGFKNLSSRNKINYLLAHQLVRKSDDDAKTVVTLNDRPAGSVTIGLKPGERQFFRVVNATPMRNLDLAVDGELLELISQDGVPLGYLPGAERKRSVPDIVLPPGGRAEFVVTGLDRPTTLRSRTFDSGPKGDKNPAVELATLDPAAPPDAVENRLPMPSVAVKPPHDYYRTLPTAPARHRTVVLAENAEGSRFFINRKSFDMRDPAMFVAKSGTVEEWTLRNESEEVHTFHMHQVHFIVESVNGRPIPERERQWRDTYNVPYARNHVPGTAKILVDFRDPVVRGTFVFHCHILDHEDGGMMAKVRVEA